MRTQRAMQPVTPCFKSIILPFVLQYFSAMKYSLLFCPIICCCLITVLYKKKKKYFNFICVYMFNTQKSDDRVNTEKYRNSKLHIKKKTCTGIDQSSEFAVSDRFWKNGIFAALLKTLLTKKFALQELLIQQRTDLAVLPALIELLLDLFLFRVSSSSGVWIDKSNDN